MRAYVFLLEFSVVPSFSFKVVPSAPRSLTGESEGVTVAREGIHPCELYQHLKRAIALFVDGRALPDAAAAALAQ